MFLNNVKYASVFLPAGDKIAKIFCILKRCRTEIEKCKREADNSFAPFGKHCPFPV